MTKQEEIGEGIEVKLGKLVHYVTVEGKCFDNPLKAATNDLLRYLRSQGVVIKMDRELHELPFPEYSPIPTADDGYNRGHERGFKCGVIDTINEYEKAGYEAVVPLME